MNRSRERREPDDLICACASREHDRIYGGESGVFERLSSLRSASDALNQTIAARYTTRDATARTVPHHLPTHLLDNRKVSAEHVSSR